MASSNLLPRFAVEEFLLFSNNPQKPVLQGWICFELACELGCDGRDIGVMDAACAHTLMDGVNHDGATAGFE